MACVTLKRSHNFESATPPSHQHNHAESPSSKRRRCGTSQLTFIPPPISNPSTSTSPFSVHVPGTFTSSPTELFERVQAEIRRLQRRKIIPRFHRSTGRDGNSGSHGGHSSDSSSDSESSAAPLGPDHLPNSSRCERMTEDVNGSMSVLTNDGASCSTSADHMESCVRQMSPVFRCSSPERAVPPAKMDVPLFSFRQINLICARLLREREEQLRGEYDGILTSKLAGNNQITGTLCICGLIVKELFKYVFLGLFLSTRYLFKLFF